MEFHNTVSESDPVGYKSAARLLVCLRDMWLGTAQGLKEKSGAMKLLPENIRVLYFASGEPYVEVGHLYLITLGVQLYCM